MPKVKWYTSLLPELRPFEVADRGQSASVVTFSAGFVRVVWGREGKDASLAVTCNALAAGANREEERAYPLGV